MVKPGQPLQDADDCETSGETIALVQILELGHRQIEAGQVQLAASVIARLRETAILMHFGGAV